MFLSRAIIVTRLPLSHLGHLTQTIIGYATIATEPSKKHKKQKPFTDPSLSPSAEVGFQMRQMPRQNPR